MTVSEAQRDLRRAYVGGGPGAFISALVWLAAAIVHADRGVGPSFAALFFGGMLIFPLATLACRTLFGRAKEAADNPLGRVALESTIAMVGGLFAAWLFLAREPDLVFPLAAIAVGTHYAVFRTVYGDAMYWLLGALVAIVGFLDIYDAVPIPGGPILAVAAIEAAFGVVLIMRASRKEQSDAGRGDVAPA